MTSLYDEARALFTPELMDRLQGYFGVTPVMLERAVRAAIAALTSGAIDQASTEDGATTMLAGLHQPMIVPPADLRAAIKQGEPLVDTLLGPRLKSARDLITTSSNVSASTASGLLALAAPMVIATLGRVHAADATEFEAMLTSQRRSVLNAGPAGVTSLIEDGGFTWRHLLPMILIGLVLLIVPIMYKGCNDAAVPEPIVSAAVPPVVAEVKAEKIELPNGGAVTARPGTLIYELAKFLAGAEPAPKRFTLDHLEFEPNAAIVQPESRTVLGDLATILKAYPAVDVSLEGHADLALARANAIKAALQSEGVAAKRITATGAGELVVVKK